MQDNRGRMEDEDEDLFMDSFDADLLQMPGDKTVNCHNVNKDSVKSESTQDKTTEKQKCSEKHSLGFISAQKLYENRLKQEKENLEKSKKVLFEKTASKNNGALKEIKTRNDSNSKKTDDVQVGTSASKIVTKVKSPHLDTGKFSPNVKHCEAPNNQNQFSKSKNKSFKDEVEVDDKSKPENKDYDIIETSDNKEEDPACDLSRWGLPESILAGYADKGIKKMFPWQVECLRSDRVMEGRNLVYSAPTSAGKSLVAEILMIKRVIESGRKALLILPFVSLAREKMFHLQHVLGDTGIRVEGFMGSISPAGGIKVADVGVATIEKANGIVNRLLEEGELDKIGCVVIDELHLLGDSSRGYLLELLLTKIRYVSLGYEDPDKCVQIVGMSATLPNLRDLSDWLEAALYTTDFRPVPLTELIKIGRTLYDTSLKAVGMVVPSIQINNDTENMTWLSLETILAGHSILIFCPIKSWVEKLAEAVARDLFQVGRPDPEDKDPVSCDVRTRLQAQLDGFKLGEVLEQLKRCPSGLDNTLASTLRFGVGFHHAGLTTDERDILEGNFKSGVIRVLVATSTLSSGVNLPARRVILRCPMTYNGQLMEKLAYKQMVGRAGRKGVDTAGESILICKESEKSKVGDLVSGDTEPVYSCLAAGGNKLAASMKRAILEVVVSGAASTREQVHRYASCTLLAAQMKREGGEENTIITCIEFLENNEFIRVQKEDDSDDHRYVPSRLGMACLASSLAPDEGLMVFKELEKARKQFVLENELHIIYLIVPIYAAVSWPKLDWMGFLSMWEGLSEDMRRVGQIVGVEERWMVRAMRGTLRSTDPVQRNALAVHQRFYTALALHDLAHEVPLPTVASKFGATKGMLQSLQQAASTFAGMVTVFCARLGWNNLELLLGQFQDRLEFGVRRELIDLCRLASVDGARARILFNGGIETVAQLAASKSDAVENILYSAEPFKSKRDQQEPKKVKTVFISGLPPMTESDAASLMVTEARSVLQRDLGLQAGAWLATQQHQETVKGTPTNKHPLKRGSSGSRSGSSRRRRSNLEERRTPDASPHLVYHMKDMLLAQQDVSQQLEFKSPDVPVKNVSKSIIGNKDIFISPPEQQRKRKLDNSVAQEPDNSKDDTKTNQFDMSSILENIFENEIEMEEEGVNIKSTSPHKLVSDDSSPQLKKCQEEQSTVKKEEAPVTEDFYCEELTLELSETDEESEKMELDLEVKKDATSDAPDTNNDINADEADKEDIPAISADTIATWEDDLFDSSNPVTNDNETDTENESDIINESSTDNSLAVKSNQVTPMSYSRMKRSLKERKKTAKSIRKTGHSPGDLIMSDSDDGAATSGRKRPRLCLANNIKYKDDKRKPEEKAKSSARLETAASEEENSESFSIVDVASHRNLFKSFVEDFKSVQSYSFAVGVRSTGSKASEEEENSEKDSKGIVDGVSFCFSDNKTAFYLSLGSSSEEVNLDPDTSCPAPQSDASISLEEKVKFLRWLARSKIPCHAMSWRRQHHYLFSVTGQLPACSGADPGVAAWTQDPGATPQTLNRMILEKIPSLTGLAGRLGSGPGVGSVATCLYTTVPARMRASVETILVHHLHQILAQELQDKGLYEHFIKVEMKVELVLLGMELTGMSISLQEYRETKLLLEERCKIIEEEAYKLAGRHFTFSSPSDVIRLLYHEMKFPVNGDPKLSLNMVRRGKGGVRLSAAKDILEKLATNHPLPKLILEHRRISGALTRTVNPLLMSSNDVLAHQSHTRVYTTAITNTATGRISLQEPNLQNIPKDFEVDLTDDLRQRALGRRSKRRSSSSNRSLISRHLQNLLEPSQPSSTISLRNALTPGEGNLFLSADYSQLELRILAHLSQDQRLLETLQRDGDVFKALASRLHKVEEDSVTDVQRQQAKQIVYGIVYGVGAKSLGEQLNISESEADKFMDNFKCKYPGVRQFLNKCVASARKTGHVETISGRCRSIPDILATNSHRRAAAERQAVNTRVQGSAADLVKVAMVNIDNKLNKIYPARKPYRAGKKTCRGAWLALQLHDELIYEVPSDDVIKIADVVRLQMETAIKLTVPLPVRIKVGHTWGTINILNLQSK